MGVAGLWEVLRPAGQVRSLTDLAVEDGFNANPSHQRGFRIGIDASIWFFHAAYGREGENPELRTLFFRCCRLLQSPFLPLFVFDGPHRPAVKRGKRVGGNAHWLTEGMKNIIDAFGFEWRVAPGEAEAELAYLNRIGIIDAILSDDVDNFLFGATMVIRNPSNTLSGNRAHPIKNAKGKDDGNHVVTYTSNAILSEPSVALSRAGTILIGLLSGGDYIPAGLPGCGQKFATGLARAGFGDSLMKAVKELKGSRLDAFLDRWRQDIKNELKTNRSGLLPSKKPSLAASLPDDFPSLPVFMSYADPLTSENTPQKSNRKTPLGVWKNDPDPMRIASLCELYFEWGVKDVIVHRFRTVLWPGIVCRAVRRVIMDEEARRHPYRSQQPGTVPSSPTKEISSTLSALALSSPSKKSTVQGICASLSESFILSSLVRLTISRSTSPSSPTDSTPGSSQLLLEVLSHRAHASTDSTLEYRVLIDPTTLVERAESGVKGLRPPLVGGLFGIDDEDENDDDTDECGSDDSADGIERLETAAGAASKSGIKKRKARREVPTKPLRLWLPACMIQAAAPALAEAYEEKVKAREEKKAKRGTRGGRGGRAATGAKSTSRKTKGKEITAYDDGDESVPGSSSLKATMGPKTKTKVIGMGGGRRRKPKLASEEQNDAYEFIDLSAGESPCSSDEEGVVENTKTKGKAKAKTRSSNKTTRAGAKATVDPALPKRIHAGKKEVLPPPLPKSSRPLELLRAKSKSSASQNLTCKSKVSVPLYEDDESPPDSPPGTKLLISSSSRRSTQPVPQARKKPLFVDVSDSDSEIEVSDIRQALSGTTTATFNPMPMSQSPSKLSHILPPLSGLESEETDKGSEGDELPTFCPGSTKPKTKKTKGAIARTAPRPFPMQLVVEPPVSPRASRLEPVRSRRYDEHDDMVEIVDVFTTPCGPSPPRSPTPTPSPSSVKIPLVHIPVAATFAKPKHSKESSTSLVGSPTDAEVHQNTKQRRRVSLDRDRLLSDCEDDEIYKSPRKSAVHSSPRHISQTCGRAASPTPLRPFHSRSRDTERRGTSAGHHSQPEDSGSTYRTHESRKPRTSDTSAIYISSGSEDELDNGQNGEVDSNKDWSEYTDEDDVDGWADKGMILSTPPSPAQSSPFLPADPIPTAEVVPHHLAPRSKFKPAVATGSKPTMRESSAEPLAPTRTTPTDVFGGLNARDDVASRPVRSAPLLVARARGSQNREDVIDLTSD